MNEKFGAAGLFFLAGQIHMVAVEKIKEGDAVGSCTFALVLALVIFVATLIQKRLTIPD